MKAREIGEMVILAASLVLIISGSVVYMAGRFGAEGAGGALVFFGIVAYLAVRT